jgi:hypothetical protein
MTEMIQSKDLFAALSKAQAEISGALKDSDNPFFKSKYADLASVMDACRLPLTRNGLSYIQKTYSVNDKYFIETILAHSSGQSITSGPVEVLISKRDAQGFGSAITYFRRYQLSALIGVAQIDDDANHATGKELPQAQARPAMQAPRPQQAPGPQATRPAPTPVRPVTNYAPQTAAEAALMNNLGR